MPIDYKKYHPEWKKRIRPEIIRRADNKCEFCLVKNHNIIIRGNWSGVDCYQDMDGFIYRESDSKYIGGDYVGEVHPTNTMIKVVLTIAHLDHDIDNNCYSNLAALCQKCHNRLDAPNRIKNRKAKATQPTLF